MSRKSLTEAQIVDLLQRTLTETENLTHEQVRALLPSFVDAERSGVDVDNVPAYSALLKHLDGCTDCMDHYLALAESLEALVGEQEVLPQVESSAPRFFEPVRQNEQIILRVLRGFTSRFGLTLRAPDLRNQVATLGSGPQIDLFNDTLKELDSRPFVSVSLRVQRGAPELLVAVRAKGTPAQWQVQLQLGEQVYSGLTDERGIARLSGFSKEQLAAVDRLELLCTKVEPPLR